MSVTITLTDHEADELEQVLLDEVYGDLDVRNEYDRDRNALLDALDRLENARNER